MKKSQYEAYFKDKKVTAMGIGLLARGLGDIYFMASCGADIIATDLRSKTTLKQPLDKLKPFRNIKFTLNKHRIGDFRNRDLVVHAAGIPKDNKYLRESREQDIPTWMSFALLMDIINKEGLNVRVIGVTGTKGKTSTTGMIESILKEAGLRYHLAGNVRGLANLPILKKIKDDDIILAELDSWQLQGLQKIKWSPHISVFTNFFEDHMNYYQGSMQDYFNDKSLIFKYQKNEDHLILTQASNRALLEYYRQNIKSKKTLARFKQLPQSWKYQVFGNHNKKNLALAYQLGKILSIPQKIIKQALTSFKGIEGRFEYMGCSQKKDLLFFNDNNSTTPDSTIESLNALKKEYPKRNIILIAGGADKNFHYQKLARYIARNIKSSFLFTGKATEKIIELFPQSFKNYTKTLSMKTACNLAVRQAEKGDIIILSPAAASFGLFNNEYERNDQFRSWVHSYLKRN